MIEASPGSVGTKTVLFTDVVDSTAARSTLGDAAADELGRDIHRLHETAIEATAGHSILARKLSASLGRRFFRGFLAHERDGEHRLEFELTDAIAEQLRLR